VRGFLVGTMLLVGLEVLVQPQTSSQVSSGGNVLVGLLRRLLSPDVAGIPDRAGTATQQQAQDSPTTAQILGQEHAANQLRSTDGGGSTAPGAGH
jgi:hypothetical protein